MPIRKLRSRRHNPDVDRYVATFGGQTSMLLFMLDCGTFTEDIPHGMLPALVERYRDQLQPNGWAVRQVEGESRQGAV